MALTISDSNLANFSDAAVFVHPDAGLALIRDLAALSIPGASLFPTRSTTVEGRGRRPVHVQRHDQQLERGRPGQLRHRGRHRLAQPDRAGPAEQHVLQQPDRPGHRTPPTSLRPPTRSTTRSTGWRWTTSSPTPRPPRSMATGQEFGSQAQYNLYWQNGSNLDAQRHHHRRLRRELRCGPRQPRVRRPGRRQLPAHGQLGGDRRGAERNRPAARRATRSSRPSPRCSPPSAASAPTPPA